jgi:hypothetical protein
MTCHNTTPPEYIISRVPKTPEVTITRSLAHVQTNSLHAQKVYKVKKKMATFFFLGAKN